MKRKKKAMKYMQFVQKRSSFKVANKVVKEISNIKENLSTLSWNNGKNMLRAFQEMARPYLSTSVVCYKTENVLEIISFKTIDHVGHCAG